MNDADNNAHLQRDPPRPGAIAVRVMEATGVIAFLVLYAFAMQRCLLAMAGYPPALLAVVVTLALVAGYCLADFLSGLVHFLMDHFGSTRTPFFGPLFIKPFREHHVDPADITRHGFLETNGNNCIAVTLGLLLLEYSMTPEHSVLALWIYAVLLAAAAPLAMTNQIHKWAHQRKVTPVIACLQRSGLILPPSVHNIHHHPPFNSYFCITSGILNRVLHRSHFFGALYRVLTLGKPYHNIH